MKFSDVLNSPLRLFGAKLVRLSTLEKMQKPVTDPAADIRRDVAFMHLFAKVEPYTMAGLERSYSLYKSLAFLHHNNIKGDLVECGVWRGGSCMLMAYYLQSVGDTSRKIYLYDTFEGMTQPGDADGEKEKQEWKRLQQNEQTNNWCLSPLEEVKANMMKSGYPANNLIYVKGKVEDTLPGTMPTEIALLRLDTDWYASTLHELKHLFPLLAQKGILLIDDYGVWQGAQKATDEYFSNQPYFLQRIDSSGRLVINC